MNCQLCRMVFNHFNDAQGGATFDPAVIQQIIEMVNMIMQALEDCDKSEDQALELFHNPTRLQRRWIKWKTVGLFGRADYRVYGNDFVESVFAAGRDATVEHVREAMYMGI